ncbi:glycine--tRNA ligase [Candidatus Woesearchaeota archaeon]|nr:glycine--tRNA ligase [Candidatus Woesearchaeota archaeon]
MQKGTNLYDEIIELASRKSIFYPSNEIYNAPAGFWSFGPLGESIRRRVIEFWRKEFVQKNEMFEIDGCQTMPDDVFKASGHLTSLVDPETVCKKCKGRFRVDKLLEEKLNKNIPESLSLSEFNALVKKNNIKCPSCKGDLGDVEKSSLMVETKLRGNNKFYLRPEACQSIFLDFLRMSKTMRLTLPKGIAQVGKAFRNEISPRQSILRAVEFSQMEAEVFFNPDKINDVEDFKSVENYKLRILKLDSKNVEDVSCKDAVQKKIVSGKLPCYYLAKAQQFFEKLGIPRDKMRYRELSKDDRAFYSKETFDFEVLTSVGWLELSANNYRQDYDLKSHSEGSKQDLSFSEDGKKFIPHIFEISIGVDRTLYAVLELSFLKEKERNVLKLNPRLSPYDVGIFPLVNRDGMDTKAKEIVKLLRDNLYDVFYDDSGSVGRRYRRMDECGVKFCVTVDGESLKKNDVTVRDRDSMKQVRVKISDLPRILNEIIVFNKDIKEFGKVI